MKILSENDIEELIVKGKISPKDRFKSGIMVVVPKEEKVIAAEDRMAASLDKLTNLVATIALEAKKAKEPKDDTSMDETNKALSKLTDLIDIITKRLTSPVIKNKKEYSLKVKRDNNGLAESLNIKEV